MPPLDPAPWLEPLLHLPDGLLYVLLFGFALLENLVPPFPGDALVVFGGYLAGLGRLSVVAAYVLVTLGSWGGFMAYYALGRVLGRGTVHARLGRLLSPERLERSEAWVRRYGLWAVLGNRALAGARSVISLAAGFADLPVLAVGGLALLSAALWNVLLVGTGYAIGENWQDALRLLEVYNRLVLGALALLVLGLWLRWRLRR
jgi:membrane protein DedA with SNARE-associated domain